jgi:hypothetical protein
LDKNKLKERKLFLQWLHFFDILLAIVGPFCSRSLEVSMQQKLVSQNHKTIGGFF